MDFARFVFAFLLGAHSCYAANWAQASGEIQQNIVLPYYPSPDRTHWSPRYGQTAIVLPASNVEAQAYVFLMGGDSFSNAVDGKDLVPGQIDTRWERSYKNDVWRTEGTDWSVTSNFRLRSRYGRKEPVITSEMTWEQVTEGLHPPVGETYDDWISCASAELNSIISRKTCTSYGDVDIQWSPRRHTAGIFFQGYMWIMGGRAREFTALSESKRVGGVIGPRVAEISDPDGTTGQRYTTKREAIVLKSDVWRSSNGRDWELIQPGCKAPQRDLVAFGNRVDKEQGRVSEKCSSDRDCYGAEKCDLTLRTCVCQMWSSREQHAVAAYGNYMYLVGGVTSALYSQQSNCGPYACGDTDASSYRHYLGDVWRSMDGRNWTLLTPHGIPGRGGHALVSLLAPGSTTVQELWVLGGRGGSNTVGPAHLVYFNDIWVTTVSDDAHSARNWTALSMPGPDGDGLTTAMPWLPRAGLAVALETPSSQNLYTRSLYLSGGFTPLSMVLTDDDASAGSVQQAMETNNPEEGFSYAANETVLDDFWSWRLDEPGEGWRQDYTAQEIYGTGTGTAFQYRNSSPAQYYIAPDSDLTYLRRFWVPAKPRSSLGQPYELRPYLSAEEVRAMKSVGLHTVRDLAEADLYTILKLRGFDIPQVPQQDRLHVDQICDYRALAIAVVDKCSLNPPNRFDGERNQPYNIIPVFGGAPPLTTKPAAWHGRRNYNFLKEVDDPTTLLETWDGCTYIASIQGLFGPNVDGLGYVDQVTSIADPSRELANLFCKQGPGARSFHNLVAFEGRIYLFGGQQSSVSNKADSWYRDAVFPTARILKAPKSRSSQKRFQFAADEPGVHFEYRVWDPENYKEVRPWSKVVKKTGIVWLNWRRNGPGSGLYQLYVRAVDPAGNVDARFALGQNVYQWYYVAPLPWDIIGGCLAAFLGLCFLAYLEYRRRVKKAAMERYAMKRMRRKFKAMQRDLDGKAVDWRTLYLESKQAEEAGLKIDQRKLKKTKDKNAEKREKEKKKREKEKELIKRKLKASKEVRGGGLRKVGVDPGDGASEKRIQSVSKSKPGASQGGGRVAKKGVLPGVQEGNEGNQDDDALLLTKEKERNTGEGTLISRGGAKGGEGALGGARELAAGDLAASANTETGFKQRKVNKRYKNYEMAGGAGEEDKADDEHKKAH